MKTLIAVVLLSLFVGLLNQAVAQSFNNRGDDFVTALPAGSNKPHQGAVIPFQGFNDRGKDFVAALPAGADSPHQGAVIPLQGFNDRGNVSQPR